MASSQKLVNLFYNLAGQIHPDQVKLACNHLRNKGVIILPTDTLYGLAARVEDTEAIERIYEIKGRQKDKPLAVCVAHIDQIKEVADISTVKDQLFKCLLPGPVTIVLNRSKHLNPKLNPDFDTIGVRIPDQNFIAAITHEVGPLALTSANRSGEQDPTDTEDIIKLLDEVDCAFEVGLLNKIPDIGDGTVINHCGSTVVDLCTPKKFKIIRKGCALHRTTNMLIRFGYRPDKTTNE